MKKEPKMYMDKIHGFKVYSVSRTSAWGIIRNKCHELGLEVPTIDEIVKL